MKNKIIYSVFIAIITVMAYFLYKQNAEINDLEMVLDQCSERYYKEIGVIKK